MAANTISGLGKPRDRFWGPGRVLPEAPEGDSDETVGKNSAGPSKTHETVSKNSDRRLKTYDFEWDCQQKQTSGEPPETQKHRILTRLSIKRRKTIENERCRFERQSQQKVRFSIARYMKNTFLLRLSAKSWVREPDSLLFAQTVSKKLRWEWESQLFAETVSKKLCFREGIIAFCWDCQLKVAFEHGNLSFLLRLSAKSCVWEHKS